MASDPPERPVQCTAKVTLTVEVYRRSVWGRDCTVQQVHDQAEREALEEIDKLRNVCRVVGKPIVQLVTFRERDDAGE